MNVHRGVKSQGGLSSMLNQAFSHRHRFKTGVWALECWESWAAMNQGHESELSVHPSKYPTAGLQELHNLSLFVHESRRWQNHSSFLWLSAWLERRVPSYRISLNRGWTVYTNGQRAYHSLCFCYICGLAKWLQFKKAQHKPGLTNTGAGGMLYLYSRGLPWGVSSLDSAAVLTVCLIKQVPGEQASSRKLDRVMSHIILHQGWPWHYTWISGWLLNPGRTKRGKRPTMFWSLKASYLWNSGIIQI